MGDMKLLDSVAVFRLSSARYLLNVVFLQDNSLRRHPGYPRNGGRIIPDEREVKSMSQFDCLCSALVFRVCAASPFFHPPVSSWLRASPSSSLPHPAPLTRCPALSRTPVISWGRGNRHHGLSSHPSSCTWPLPSPRAPLLQGTTYQRETEVRLVKPLKRQRGKEKNNMVDKLLENMELGIRKVI